VERVEHEGGLVTLRFAGELRFRQCFPSWERVGQLARPPGARTELDLAAVEHLDGAAAALLLDLRYELAANGLTHGHFYLGGLHSAYVRGEAFLAAHRYAEAAAEFQKILDHRGIVGLDPIGALAHLQLGRVFALSGDKTKAKTAYEAFLALWKDADADIPILKSARAEYARL
jgi:ABC-type transporter Mla MlaB component